MNQFNNFSKLTVVLGKILKRIKNIFKEDIHQKRIVRLQSGKGKKGCVLLAYIINPFLLSGKALEELLKTHTHYWESLQISNIFLEMGYDVDVISYLNEIFIPKKDYTIFISARTNLQKIANTLNPDCIKIAHLDTAHWLFHNFSAHKRYFSLQRRRGVTARTRKLVRENWAIESADFATMIGNEFTKSTYAYANKTIYGLPVPSVQVYSWNEGKCYDSCRKRFIWMGSEALVHKGLDLVIEAFLRMPDFELVICGPIENETDFCHFYHKELYKTSNITTIGWVDITSQQFIEIANSCIGLIYPSCSEGQSGAVVTCMQAGLIPIISYESGVDVEDFGIILDDCSLETIEQSVRSLSARSTEELKRMSRLSWEYVRRNSTREKYTEVFRTAIESIMIESGLM